MQKAKENEGSGTKEPDRMYAYGPIFRCKGPALKSDYNGTMLTPADMKRQVQNFYSRSTPMYVNENHKGERAEIGVIHNMWVTDAHELMVEFEVIARNMYSRERLHQLHTDKPVGLSLEITREQLEMPSGECRVINKRITGVATTDDPDHKETWVHFADPDPDTVLRRAFSGAFGPEGDSSRRPLVIRNDLKARVKRLFTQETTEAPPETTAAPVATANDDDDDTEPAAPPPSKEELKEHAADQPKEQGEDPVAEQQQQQQQQEVKEKEHEEEEEEEEAGWGEKTAERATQERKEKPEQDRSDPLDPSHGANNMNVDDFDEASATVLGAGNATNAAHSLQTQSDMSDKKQKQQQQEQSNQEAGETRTSAEGASAEMERIRQENEQLKQRFVEEMQQKKRSFDELRAENGAEGNPKENDGGEGEKRARTEDGYQLTSEDKRKDWDKTKEILDEYFNLEGMTDEDAFEYVKKQAAKKRDKARKQLQESMRHLDDQLRDSGLSAAEISNIKKIAMDTSNPEAAAAVRSYAAAAHRSALSHRRQEEEFQRQQRQHQAQGAARPPPPRILPSETAQHGSVVGRDLLAASTRRFRSAFTDQPEHLDNDAMDVDQDPGPRQQPQSRGNVGLSHQRAMRSQQQQQQQQQQPGTQLFQQPKPKQHFNMETMAERFAPLEKRFGQNSWQTSVKPTGFDPRQLSGNPEDPLNQLYSYFKSTPPSSRRNVPSKGVQLDIRQPYAEKTSSEQRPSTASLF